MMDMYWWSYIRFQIRVPHYIPHESHIQCTLTSDLVSTSSNLRMILFLVKRLRSFVVDTSATDSPGKPILSSRL